MTNLQLRTFAHVLMSVHDAGLIGVTSAELLASFDADIITETDDRDQAGRIFANTCAWMTSQGLIVALPGGILCITRSGIGAMSIRVNDGNNALAPLSSLCVAVLDGTSKASDSDIHGMMSLKG